MAEGTGPAVNVVPVVVPITREVNHPSKAYTLYPTTPTLSVDGDQLSSTPGVLPEMAIRFVGADGGTVSPVSVAGVTTVSGTDDAELRPSVSTALTESVNSCRGPMLWVSVHVVTGPVVRSPPMTSLKVGTTLMEYEAIGQQPGVDAVHDRVIDFVVTLVTTRLVGALGGNGEVPGVLGLWLGEIGTIGTGELPGGQVVSAAGGATAPWAPVLATSPIPVMAVTTATTAMSRERRDLEVVRA